MGLGSYLLALFLVGCLISLICGWILAKNHFHARLTKELRDEAAEQFRQEFFDMFVQKFDERVELRAVELAIKLVEAYENELKEENNDESSGSG